MEEAFYRECGEYVKNHSDVLLRFKAVASEIYAAYVNADYVLRQSFVQTAQGEYLERHAALRDIKRKTASKAFGKLTFSLPEALDSDTEIPAGTVCSVKDKPLIQFATDEKAVITAGELSVQAQATALEAGAEFNAPEGSVTVMVNPPEYVGSVENSEAFRGGCDAECDEALRSRIIESYGLLSNAVSEKSAQELVMSLDEVLDAKALRNTGLKSLDVYLRTKSGKVSSELSAKAGDLLGFARICNTPVLIMPASAAEFSVFAAVKANSAADLQEVNNKAVQEITRVCTGKRLGESIAVSDIISAVTAVENVISAEILAQPSHGGMITCAGGEYLVLKDVQTEVYG